MVGASRVHSALSCFRSAMQDQCRQPEVPQPEQCIRYSYWSVLTVPGSGEGAQHSWQRTWISRAWWMPSSQALGSVKSFLKKGSVQYIKIAEVNPSSIYTHMGESACMQTCTYTTYGATEEDIQSQRLDSCSARAWNCSTHIWVHTHTTQICWLLVSTYIEYIQSHTHTTYMKKFLLELLKWSEWRVSNFM